MAEPDTALVILPGSERDRLVGLQRSGPVPGDETVDVTVVLRRRAPLPPEVRSGERWLTREQLTAEHGAHGRDAERVGAALGRYGMTVVEQELGARLLTARGTADAVRAAFGVDLERVWDPVRGVSHRYRSGVLRVPVDCADAVLAVLGVDDRPQAEPRLRMPAGGGDGRSYTPPELARVYDFPDGADGSGQSVAILELGGGYRKQDLEQYFGGLGIATPTVRAVGVDGAANSPGKDRRVDVEVALDIEIAGALAPGADFTVYFAPNTDRGYVDAVSRAAHADPTPAAISVSWGQSEDSWSEQSRTAMDEALADAAALGVTACAASGDRGSSDGIEDGKSHVDFPSSSPHMLGCGGTTLRVGTSGAVESETVWHDESEGGGATGGGVSAVFGQPSWQRQAGVPEREGGGGGRGVPDVAADADPGTGYRILVGGEPATVGGTSAVSPLWAGLVACLAQRLGAPLGLAARRFYAGVRPGTTLGGFRDITEGDNGAYQAGPGWDACTGLGVPKGNALLRSLQE